jgi:hypothetical protein
LEKLGHLHTKTLNRLQTALLEHDFVVQYKKGTIMPADYLSRLPSLPVNALEQPIIAAFDPFTPDLQLLQRQDQDLQSSQIHFADTDSSLMLKQNVNVSLFEFFWNIEVGLLFSFST